MYTIENRGSVGWPLFSNFLSALVVLQYNLVHKQFENETQFTILCKKQKTSKYKIVYFCHFKFPVQTDIMEKDNHYNCTVPSLLYFLMVFFFTIRSRVELFQMWVNSIFGNQWTFMTTKGLVLYINANVGLRVLYCSVINFPYFFSQTTKSIFFGFACITQ